MAAISGGIVDEKRCPLRKRKMIAPVWINVSAAHTVPEKYPLRNMAKSIKPAFSIQEGLIMPSMEIAPLLQEIMDISAHKIKMA